MEERGNQEQGTARQGNGAHAEGQRGGLPLDGVGDEVNRQLDELRARLDDMVDEAARFIRRRPGTSLLIAAGAGYLLGRIVRS